MYLVLGKGSTSSFAWGDPDFLAPFVEKTVLSTTFPLLNGLGTLVKNHLTVYVRVYL